MQNLLDILGSTVIGMYFMYMVMNFNIKMSDSLNASVVNNINKWDAIELGKLLDYDFNKIGFRVDSANIFSVAKEDEFNYLVDVDNDGSVDSVRYILGTTNEAANTTNPNDKPIYRIINNSDTTISLVNTFEFSYFDSTGNTITPISSLSSSAERKKIKGIMVVCNLQSPDPINEDYQEVDWKKKFFPKNIN